MTLWRAVIREKRGINYVTSMSKSMAEHVPYRQRGILKEEVLLRGKNKKDKKLWRAVIRDKKL